MKRILWGLSILLTVIFGGCGYNSSLPEADTGTGGTTANVVAGLDLTASKLMLESNGTDTIDFTVYAKNAKNAAASAATISVVSTGGVLSAGNIKTGTDGKATFSLGVGDAANYQEVTVTLTAGSIVKKQRLTINGTPVTPSLMGGAIQGNPIIKGYTPRINPATVSTLAGSGLGTWETVDGIGAAATFGLSTGITTDGSNLYVAEYNGDIRKTVIATGEVTTLAGTYDYMNHAAVDKEYLYADGTGTAARFNYPAGITTDGLNLYVADRWNKNIRKIVIATGEVTTLAGQDSGVPPSLVIDGIGTAARFGEPIGITTDGTNLYVADFGYCSIRKIVIATGEVTTLAGSAGNAGFASGIGAAATFGGLQGITTDGTYLYVTDSFLIRKVEIATAEVTNIAVWMPDDRFPDGINTTSSGFLKPSGIITDGTYLYVTDEEECIVRRINILTKEITTLAGAPYGTLPADAPGDVNGTGEEVRISTRLDITTDGKSLYIADGLNGKIKKMQ